MSKATIEQMVYKGFGFDSPESNRENKGAKPNRKLAEAFEKWLPKAKNLLSSFDLEFKLACELVSNIEIKSADEAHDLLLKYQHHPNYIEDAGLFISALYQKVPESTIVYDLELDSKINLLGWELPKDKKLITLRVDPMCCVGCSGQGTVINYDFLVDPQVENLQPSGVALNYGYCEQFGSSSEGLLINCGDANLILTDQTGKGPKINFGTWISPNFHSASLLVNYGTVMKRENSSDECKNDEGIVIAAKNFNSFRSMSKPRLLLKEKDCKRIPELTVYLDKMKADLEAGRKDYKKAIAVLDKLGEYPGKKVEKDITQILGRAGYNV